MVLIHYIFIYTKRICCPTAADTSKKCHQPTPNVRAREIFHNIYITCEQIKRIFFYGCIIYVLLVVVKNVYINSLWFAFFLFYLLLGAR